MFKKTTIFLLALSAFFSLPTPVFCAEHDKTAAKIDKSDLMFALDANNIELAKELLSTKGPEENKSNPDINAVLFKAIAQKNKPFIKLLLDHGANLFEPNEKGESPWIKALESNDEDFIKFLRTYKPINKTMSHQKPSDNNPPKR